MAKATPADVLEALCRCSEQRYDGEVPTSAVQRELPMPCKPELVRLRLYWLVHHGMATSRRNGSCIIWRPASAIRVHFHDTGEVLGVEGVRKAWRVGR
jgi:hypothetical protein